MIMNITMSLVKSVALTTALLSSAIAASVYASPESKRGESTSKLLTANFSPRKVVKIEAGDFHFVPGQIAPIHTHDAPAIGYVSKGEILYQVEGEKPQLLREGDAFYEPAGPRILRFDNASATEEAIFIDFNLQQQGEPFIVFEEELTEHIDRRTLATVELEEETISQADIFVSELEPKGSKILKVNDVPVLGYVAEGAIKIKIPGEGTKRIHAGDSFYLPGGDVSATIKNESSKVPAKVISFYLL